MYVCDNGSNWIAFSILLFCYGKYTEASSMDTVVVDLSEKCGEVESMTGKASLRIQADASSFERPDFQCTLTLTADPGNLLMIKFTDLRMASRGNCNSDWLSLHDGSTISARPLVVYSVCGKTYYSAQYTTLRTSTTLYFRGHKDLTEAKFDAVITQFHFGRCDSDAGEIRCANHRCIAEGLRCNSHNPCGDYSDCYFTVEVRRVVHFLAGVAVFPTILIVLICIVRRKRRRQ